ncbi:NAD-binding protein [Crenobacter sp. SG2303]|uniref:NAD-binding protein n=1 Tax=Crenobacter oryzisoli TaxID=3056844 RepID=A0ABT7XUZ2_9NEIS|nr:MULTISPECIES: NAD(P)-binding protein [unclassified Crenobacter]MDN0077612.1 NAD-binding protein [Crenobacter sp. SG2303]MDN0085254.1 NAD-binding protein [Crenobacter sp. SG2305]
MLLLLLVIVATGLTLLDDSNAPLSTKAFHALWDGVNLVTTLGDFSNFDERQKLFMLAAMLATMVIAAVAISMLTGLLSGDDVMIYRENRAMERKLEQLANHVVVVGFLSLGETVAEHLRKAGETVLVLVTDPALADRASVRGHLVLLGSPDVIDDVLHHARLDSAKAMIVTTPDANNNLAITLMVHTLNASLTIIVPGENDLRKGLLMTAGASEVVIADELLAGAMVGKLTSHARVTP